MKLDLSKQIPSSYLPIVICYYKIRNVFQADIVVYTSDGELITFRKRTVYSRCSVGLITYHRVSEIFMFNTYKPYREYFLLKSNGDRVIVVRQEPASCIVCDIFDDVCRIEIVDYFNIGRPQVKLTLNNSSVQTVTDFYTIATSVLSSSSSSSFSDNNRYKPVDNNNGLINSCRKPVDNNNGLINSCRKPVDNNNGLINSCRKPVDNNNGLINSCRKSNSNNNNNNNNNNNGLNNVITFKLRSDAFILEKTLQEKRILRKSLTKRVLAIEPQQLLTVGSIRKKLFNRQWCILYSIRNLCNSVLSNVHVNLIGTTTVGFVYRVRLFLFKRSSEVFAFNSHCRPLLFYSTNTDDYCSRGPLSSQFSLKPRTEYFVAISFPFQNSTVFARPVRTYFSTVSYSIDKFRVAVSSTAKFCLTESDVNDLDCRVMVVSRMCDSCYDGGNILNVIAIIMTSGRRYYKLYIEQQQHSSYDHRRTMDSILSAYGLNRIVGNYFFKSSIDDSILVYIEHRNSAATLLWRLELYTISQRVALNFVSYLADNLPTNMKITLEPSGGGPPPRRRRQQQQISSDQSDSNVLLLSNEIENRLKSLLKFVEISSSY